MPMILYAENYPKCDGIASTGLDRALVPIYSALKNDTDVVALLPPSGRERLHELHAEFRSHVVMPSIIHTAFYEVARRSGFLKIQAGKAYSQSLIRRLSRRVETSSNVVFSVLGSSYQSYVRSSILANALGGRHVIYSVDDPVQHLRESGSVGEDALDAMEIGMRQVFGSADRVFAISNDLAETFQSRFDVRSVASLALPYSIDAVKVSKRLKQFVYVGNVNHIYADALLDVIRCVGDVRSTLGCDVTLRVTAPEDQVAAIVRPIPDFVEVGRVASRADLCSMIAESLSAVCPISFQAGSVMTETSFPSKLLDYLAYSKQIIVYGPKNSTAFRYFKNNGLDCAVSDFDGLFKSISEVALHGAKDYSDRYRSVLIRNHGEDVFREAVVAVL